MSDSRTTMTPSVTFLTWEKFDQANHILFKKLKSDSCHFDIIVAVQRGGCVTGVWLSHTLRIDKFCTIGVRTTIGEGVRAQRQDVKLLNSGDVDQIAGLDVLLVDDVFNTGKTMEFVINLLKEKNPKSITTAVTVWDGDSSLSKSADYYGIYTPGWVVFPWEVIEEK